MKTQQTLRFAARELARITLARIWCLAVVALVSTAHAQAIEAWVQRYNGPGNGDGWAMAIAPDASGNVYVLGSTYVGRGEGDYDCATIKYSSAGVPLWTNYYNGPVNGWDGGFALGLDADGNVFVAGKSATGSNDAYVTIKYSTAGVPLWTNRYSPGSEPVALAVDGSGNVLVTGGLDVGGTTTVKYSSAGALLWARTYSGDASAMAIDASGNVVVTGWSGNSLGMPDYATVAYSSAGAPLWTNIYDGGYVGPFGDGTDRANAVAVDTSGNAFVTGRSSGGSDAYVTIKYSSAGVPLWTNSYAGARDATAVVVDRGGNAIVTGGNQDFATMKYSNAGVPLWTNLYLRPGNYGSSASALALDASGNVFVTGSEDLPGWPPNAADWITIAYSRDGMPLWTNSYNGPASSMDMARTIAVDTSGNVFVTGSSRDSGGNPNIVTVKYVTPAIITKQPLSCTNAVGTTASFSVEAVGGLPLSYQWRKSDTDLADGDNIAGVTTTNLLIAKVQLADAGGYSVLVTNAYGTATSAVAQLTVVVPPSGGQLTNLTYSPATGLSFIFRDGTVGQPYRI